MNDESVDTTILIHSDALEYTEYIDEPKLCGHNRAKVCMFVYAFFVFAVLFGGIGFIGLWLYLKE